MQRWTVIGEQWDLESLEKSIAGSGPTALVFYLISVHRSLLTPFAVECFLGALR